MGVATTALGADAKTGWCVLVGVTGDPGAPAVVARQRVELCPHTLPAFAYHAAAELPAGPAASIVERVHKAASALATDALRQVVAELAHEGHDVTVLAVAAGALGGRDDLASILRSHTRWHAAEGELYREALVDGAAAVDVPVVRFAKGAALDELSGELGREPAALIRGITAWGQALGPPWRKEHKEAAAAAWLALLRS